MFVTYRFTVLLQLVLGQLCFHFRTQRPQPYRGRGRNPNQIVHRTVVVIPETADLPSHQKRADLREQGLIIDEFPINRQWDEDDLCLHILEEIPIVHGIRKIKFMKGSYGKLSPFNLPSTVTLNGERLIRMSGQGAIYAQQIPDDNVTNVGNEHALTEHPIQSADEIDQRNESSCPVIDLSDPRPGPSSAPDEPLCRSKPTTPIDILKSVKAMFANINENYLEEVANASESTEEAVDILLNKELSVGDILERFRNANMRDQQHLLAARRENIWRDCLKFYKVASVDKKVLFKERNIDFAGEEGVDCGALKIEFFQKCLDEAMEHLFEEADDFKIPKKSSTGLISYKIAGMLIGHSILQGGPGIACFPEWLYKYLSTRDFH